MRFLFICFILFLSACGSKNESPQHKLRESYGQSESYFYLTMAPDYNNNDKTQILGQFKIEFIQYLQYRNSFQKTETEQKKYQHTARLEKNTTLESASYIKLSLDLPDYTVDLKHQLNDAEKVQTFKLSAFETVHSFKTVCMDQKCERFRICSPSRITGTFLSSDEKYEKGCQTTYEFKWTDDKAYRFSKIIYAQRSSNGDILKDSLQLECPTEKDDKIQCYSY